MQVDSNILIDTNILVYSIDLTSLNQPIARALLTDLCTKGNSFVSAQNLAEFMLVVSKKNKLDLETANRFVANLVNYMPVLAYTDTEVIRANQFHHYYKIPFFDALLVATMEREKISTIITENEKDFKKIKWLKVINPFKK